MNREGATVGGWKTWIEAAEISTFGVGGDSYIQVSQEHKLIIGPRRVWPLSVAANKFPHLIEELSRVDPERLLIGAQPTDCWMLIKKPLQKDRWNYTEWKIVEELEDSAHNIFTLAERMGNDPNLLPLKDLEQAQVIGRISFTPTRSLGTGSIFAPGGCGEVRFREGKNDSPAKRLPGWCNQPRDFGGERGDHQSYSRFNK